MKTDEMPGTYEVEDSTDNAMAMLGKGYEAPSVVVEPPTRRTERRGKKMVEVEEPAWVKFSTDFKNELAEMNEYSLKVFIYIGLSVNFHSGEACPGVRKIAEDTGMNKDTVSKAIANLAATGFLTVHNREGRRNIYKPTRYISIGTVRPERTPKHKLSDAMQKLSDENTKLSDASRVKSAQQEEQEEQELKDRATPKATDIPEVVLFHSVTGRYPSKDTFRIVALSIQKVSARLNRAVVCDDLLPFWEAWRIKDYRKTNLSWLTDWAVAGKITNGNGKTTQPKQVPDNFQAEYEAKRERVRQLRAGRQPA